MSVYRIYREPDGSGCVAAAVVGAIVALYIIFMVFAVVLVVLAHLGACVIIAVDRATCALSWLRLGPVAGWFAFGLTLGAVYSLKTTLLHTNRQAESGRYIAIAAAVIGMTALLGLRSPATVVPVQALTGTWSGTWGENHLPATLIVESSRGDEFRATLNIKYDGMIRIGMRGYHEDGSRDVRLQDWEVLAMPPGHKWSLRMIHIGILDVTGKKITGIGNSGQAAATWDFVKSSDVPMSLDAVGK